MKASIITIGDEILIGQTVDTNSAYLGGFLNSYGVDLHQNTSIHDNDVQIRKALDHARKESDLIIITGGLGPTKDDITKHVICQYFNTHLEEDAETLKHINKLLSSRGIPVNDLNQKQALVPANAQILKNRLGTAPALLFENKQQYFIFMPGVPFEMKQIVQDHFESLFKKWGIKSEFIHHTCMFQGIPESVLAEKLDDWEENLPDYIKVAYLPSPGMIRLRMTGYGLDKEYISAVIKQEQQKLKKIVPKYYFGEGDVSIEALLGKILKDNNCTLSSAESCTGGKIASMITTVPGASSYYKGTLVAYSNDIKINLLDVSPDVIKTKGAVSKEVVEKMAVQICDLLNTDYGISTSGIAGPGGGSSEKPVGTVWIGAYSKKSNNVVSKRYNFGKNRERNIIRSCYAVLNMVRNLIEEDNSRII